MKTGGIIGGTSWHSTIEYYRLINQLVGDQKGDHSSAPMVINSVNFEPIVTAFEKGDWDFISRTLVAKRDELISAGVEAFALATNTLHKVAGKLEENSSIPLLHIVDSVANSFLNSTNRKALLLGTRFTMSDNFFQSRLATKGMVAMVPSVKYQEKIDRIIFEELVHGRAREESKKFFSELVNEEAKAHEVEDVILGCTELSMVLDKSNCRHRLHDTAQIHAKSIAEFMLS